MLPLESILRIKAVFAIAGHRCIRSLEEGVARACSKRWIRMLKGCHSEGVYAKSKGEGAEDAV